MDEEDLDLRVFGNELEEEEDELEEGEYVEEGEPAKHKEKKEGSGRPFVPSTTASSSSATIFDNYEAVNMDLESDAEKEAEQPVEDDADLLRMQLLSQVRKKNANKNTPRQVSNSTAKNTTATTTTTKNGAKFERVEHVVDAVQQHQQEQENINATPQSSPPLTFAHVMKTELAELNEQLAEAQLKQSVVVRRKRRLQDSLVECETDLLRSQAEINSIVNAIGAWAKTAEAEVKPTLLAERQSQKVPLSSDESPPKKAKTTEKQQLRPIDEGHPPKRVSNGGEKAKKTAVGVCEKVAAETVKKDEKKGRKMAEEEKESSGRKSKEREKVEQNAKAVETAKNEEKRRKAVEEESSRRKSKEKEKVEQEESSRRKSKESEKVEQNAKGKGGRTIPGVGEKTSETAKNEEKRRKTVEEESSRRKSKEKEKVEQEERSRRRSKEGEKVEQTPKNAAKGRREEKERQMKRKVAPPSDNRCIFL